MIAFADLLFYSVLAGVIILLVFYFLDFRNQPVVMSRLAIFFAVSFLFDLGGEVMYRLNLNPNFSSNTYSLFSVLLFGRIFSSLIPSAKFRKILLPINLLYFAFATINFLFIQKMSIVSYSFFIEALVVVFFCIAYFYYLLISLPTQNLQRLPSFWIVSGLFFSYSGKLVIYGVTYYFITYVEYTVAYIWETHNILTLLSYIIIFIGMWINHKKIQANAYAGKVTQQF